jgi:ATP-binding protein involved in chromosome partitioning
MSDLATVNAALATVVDPTFERPMVENGALRDVALRDGVVHLTVQLASPAEVTKATARARILDALRTIGIGQAEITWATKIPTREVMGDDPIPGVRNVIFVMSGKGGVGKSTIACNLALALARLGTRVGLLDADVYGPSIPTMMGIEGPPTADEHKKIRPHERFGVKLMSIGFMLEDPKQAVVWRGPMLHSALKQLLGDVGWGELDYLVIDSPPGTGDVALTLAQSLKTTGVVIVTTPQDVALADVYKGVSMCKKLNLGVLGVVENMSWFVDPAGNKHLLFGEGGGAKIAEMAGAPLLGQIPIEQAVREQGDAGLPVVRSHPDAAASRVFMAIADALVTRIAKDHFARGGGKALPGEPPKRLRIVR